MKLTGTKKAVVISVVAACAVVYLYNTNDTVEELLGGGWF